MGWGMTVYTLGVWNVREGYAEDFVAGWRRMGEATKRQFPAASGTLLRDRDQRNRFVSFGPWESTEQVAEWRSSSAFVEGLAAIKETLESFEPHSMDLVCVVQ